ncbi:hypothetical protein J2853_001715 [Streptosporangium lutulentum]|uniref:Uncharacterized protein n=1 Tax=Streptosporangium lutulentum TaxID=1461250 RepID=A0ABT9Q6X7_9ACTN|nr:hypothetical protein [Streptosporangium lutulentum]
MNKERRLLAALTVTCTVILSLGVPVVTSAASLSASSSSATLSALHSGGKCCYE